MKLKKMFRSVVADEAAVDLEARTFEFSFSSEEPVERWFGTEILSHEDGAMDLSRVNAQAAPLLWNHDPDQPIGMIQSATVAGKRGQAKATFFSTPFAQEKMTQVKEGLRNISFGYRIKEMTQTNPGVKDADPEFLATDYEVFEVSVVSIPADASVGIGRAEKDEELDVRVANQPEGEKKMDIETMKANEQKARDEARQGERSRISTIESLGSKFGKPELARTLIDGDKSIEEARAAFLESIGSKQTPVQENTALLDLTDGEKVRYSLTNAIRAQITGNWKEAGFERELSQEIAKRMGKDTHGFFMPLNVRMNGTRSAYAAGSATTGGNLVATNLLADSFIELLRNKMLVTAMGAKSLTGLVGNIAIPKQLTAAQAYWVAEAAAVTESEGTFGQVTMSPKTVGARSQMSRQLMMQATPDVEMLIRSDLAQVLALAIDLAAISGTGASGQPTGILNQSGIGSVAMGANGAALTNIDPLIDLETAVATANADFGTLGYMTNPGVVGKLKKLKTTTGEYLWNGYEAAAAAGVPGEINGYRCGRSNQVPANLTKGTSSGDCSAVIFGNFADLVIGQWGPGVEVLANPFGAGYDSGSIDIRALATVDVAVRNAVSFAAITDIL